MVAEQQSTQSFQGKYFEAVGRRKSSVARVRLYPDEVKRGVVINNQTAQEYFNTPSLEHSAIAPLRRLKMNDTFGVSIHVKGGGIAGQADAMKLGIARALVKYDSEMRLQLKKSGYLKRDPRVKERKKYGLRGARKAPQWSKR